MRSLRGRSRCPPERLGVAHVMGVGERTLDGDVDIAVSSLCRITFDATHLVIPRNVIIEAKCWSAASSFTQMIQHSLAHFVLRAASASDWALCEQQDRKAVELANHAEVLTLRGDSHRTR